MNNAQKKYPHLFEPLKLGATYFKNRIFASPTSLQEMSEEGFPDPELIAYYEQKSKGGVASVAIGECQVHPRTGQSHTKQIHMDDPLILPSFTALATAISRHGAVATAELNHGGKYAHVTEKVAGKVKCPPFLKDGSGITYGPVAEISPEGTVIHEMTEEVLLEVIEAYGNAAELAKRCGFGMICVHGAHGWLVGQFMSPFVNTRTDRWGGSFENRMRLPLAIVEAIRGAVGPRFPIEFRMSGDECFDGGWDLDYGIKIAKALDGKVDLLHISAGNHENRDAFVDTHPSMFQEEGCNVRFAAEIKKHVKTPVATVGALSSPEQMEEILASGKADVVQIARELLVEPDYVKMVRRGQEDDIHRCLRCLCCFSYTFSNRSMRCAINPRFGQCEEQKYAAVPTERPRTVLVAGGGIGGMQAAVTASKRGHRVILCEKTDRLGGILNCEREVPFKKRLDEYLDRQARIISRCESIELRLNTEVTPELAQEIGPDAIIAALGAVPIIPRIPGIGGKNVKSVVEAYKNPEKIGNRAVIIGAGLAGLELAVYLSMLGKKAEVVEMLPEINDGGNSLHVVALDIRLRRYGIKPVFSTRAIEIGEGGLVGESPQGRRLFEADTVIYAAGMRPLWSEADGLSICAPDFYVAGDCRSPRIMADANREGYFAAMNI